MRYVVVAVERREDRPSSLRVTKVTLCGSTREVAAAISAAAEAGREWAAFEDAGDGATARVCVVLRKEGPEIVDVEIVPCPP